MKRGLALLIIFAFIFSTYIVSAEIIITQQPNEIYSLGDSITIPITVKSQTDLSGVFDMNLLCNGHTLNFYKNSISLKAGEEIKFTSPPPSVSLTKNIIGELIGDCKIKANLGSEYKLTNDFEISNAVNLSIDFNQLEFNPGENIVLKGSALKANGNDVDGYIELSLVEGNTTKIAALETIDNGFFKINTTIPKAMQAGPFLLRIDAYELDSSKEKTNQGYLTRNILIRQVPTSLEVVFDNSEVEPGTNLKVKAVLHDQTGEKILNTTGFVTVKNQNDKILEQKEIPVDEFLEFPIKYNSPPSTWKVVAVSHKLSTEANFKVLEKESISVSIINKTIEIANTGNIPYNKTVVVKIGNETLNIQVFLSVSETQRYLLSAPEGKYQVEVITGPNSTIADNIALTGKSISVKEASGNVVSLVRYPVVWIFLIAILGFVSFILYKRSHQQNFLGYISSKIPKRTKSKPISLSGNSLVQSRSPASLSLSIKGDRQNISLIGLHIKNLSSLQSKQGSAEETLQKIVNAAENEKAATYETNSYLFFILAPVKTKTFNNEKTALDVSKNIKDILEEHNRKFKNKIDFGISISYGTVVAKSERDSKTNSSVLKFMSLGKLMTSSKGLATHSKGEVLLDDKINSRLSSHVKTKKHGAGYRIEELKNAEENKKFLKSFLHRIENGNKSSDSEKPVEKE